MRIFLPGANGFIGAHLARHLIAAGHEVVGGRRGSVHPGGSGGVESWISLDFARLPDAKILTAQLTGFDVLVNCVGVLQDDLTDSLAAAHLDGAGAVFKAAEAAGVRRIVHISAIGVDAEGASGFARTKAGTEALLADREIETVILRPGLVVAHTVYGGSGLLRGFAGLPWIVPVARTAVPIQTVDMVDLCQVVSKCIGETVPTGTCIDVVSEKRYSITEIIALTRAWLGISPADIVTVPAWMARPLLMLGDGLAWLGWRQPMRTTAYRQLTAGVTGDSTAAQSLLGRPVRGLEDFFARVPATVQDRWHARLYFLKGLTIALLVLFWIVTGLIALGPGRHWALSEVMGYGLSATTGHVLLIAGGLADLAIGAGLAWRPTFRRAAWASLILSTVYLAAGTALAPALWIDPLGALIKILPVMALTGFALALEGARR